MENSKSLAKKYKIASKELYYLKQKKRESYGKVLNRSLEMTSTQNARSKIGKKSIHKIRPVITMDSENRRFSMNQRTKKTKRVQKSKMNSTHENLLNITTSEMKTTRLNNRNRSLKNNSKLSTSGTLK